MKDKNVVLLCKSVMFNSPIDEENFFEWIEHIDCVKSIDTAGDQLYLSITSNTIDGTNLDDLIGLLDRYKIDMTQLQQFLTEDNREWFFDSEAYWHNDVFGNQPTTDKSTTNITIPETAENYKRPHWDVAKPNGKHVNVYPGGKLEDEK